MDKWAIKPICIKYITSRNNKRQEKEERTVPEVTKIETRIEKCSDCKHNRSTVERNCTTHIKFDEETYYRDLPENEQEFKGLRDTAVMGMAVVQVNEKEEVSLEEVSAYTTGWLSSTRAELLVIWIATLISPSKTKVVVKTDSAVSIINIELFKHMAKARQ
ncbi:17925_t:CDS:2 [Gigaspora margarita]|uniref:17925_t:CDS:1 n=1 Tax=Gigaspora margarita TaxID=4874 RepID=A0ABN7VED5_GIGMA|nr:17925_t:CDS:2 [Gigaspora margarita]